MELKISGTTVATNNSTGLNIAGSVFDDGTALISSVSANTQLGSGVVTQHAIASGNVVTSTINNGAVTAAKIAAGNVVTAAINDAAVTGAKIADNTISAAKMTSAFINANTDFASALVDASNIKADAINPQHIADGAVNANTLISNGILTQNLIAAGNVVTSKINDAAVTSAKLATGAVSANTKMAADVVGAREIRLGNLAAANAVFTHNAHTFVKAQRGTIDAVSVGAANVTMDFANTNHFALTLGTNSNLNRPSNLTAGQTGSIFVIQDGTGSRTLSYSSVFDFAGGTAPTLTTTASAVDRIDYVVRSSSSIHAVATLALS